MIEISGFQVLEEIQNSGRSIIYRAIQEDSNTNVILKILKENLPDNNQFSKYRQEFEITSNFKAEGIIKSYNLIKDQDKFIIVFEDLSATSLNILLKQKVFDLKEFLTIAIKITEALGNLHKNNIIHKDINPSNIVYNRQTKELRIIDFGLSTVLNRENPPMHNPDIIEGTLAYMSPEQTGRMNRVLDYRTDFYSLGLTFYELLTGQRLFETVDPMELIHFHIAREPVFPLDFNQKNPQIITKLIQKLIAKTAEERYQSAWGIKADLENCFNQLGQFNNTDDFELARYDLPDKFCISQKLYGREKEIAIIYDKFESARQGNVEFVMVGGYSGIGKSTLIQEVYKPVIINNGYFCKGKFEQFQNHIPYEAISQACSALIKHILSETENSIRLWKVKLLTALGNNAALITTLVPGLEKIIGVQPEVKELNSIETQNRFQITFSNFIREFATRENPLVFFLDDLQWADIASLNLIQFILQEKEIKYFFLIGTFRDNEIDEKHQLTLCLKQIEKFLPVNKIFLNALELSNVNKIVADTLKKSEEETLELSKIIFSKSNGNPYFVNELLQALYQRNILNFNFNNYCWEWDINKTEKMAVSENVALLILNKLKECSQNAVELLKISSVYGNSFDLKTLLILIDKPFEVVILALREIIEIGAVIPLNDSYRQLKFATGQPCDFLLNSEYKFHHDKVQQSAYLLNETETLAEIHYIAGKRLLAGLNEKETELKLINIVQLLNKGISIVNNPAEKLKLAEMNLKAGIKAKLSAAFNQGLEFFKQGINLLDAQDWQYNYQLCFDLYKQFAECAYICGNFELAEDKSAFLINKAVTRLEKAEIYHLQAVQYTTIQKLQTATEVVKKALLLFSTTLPEDCPDSMVMDEFQLTIANLDGRKIADLVNLPEIGNEEIRMTVKLLQDIFLPCYSLGLKNLLAFCILRGVNLCLKYGNVSESSYIYNTYAFLLGHIFGDLKTAHEYGKLSFELNANFNDPKNKTVNMFTNVTFVQFWNKSSKDCVAAYQKVIESGLETGDLIYTSYACANILQWDYSLDLKTAIIEGDKYLKIIRSINFQDSIDVANIFQHLRLNLTGRTNGQFSLSSEVFDEQQMLCRLQKNKNYLIIALYHIYKIQPCYHFENYDQALYHAHEAEIYLEALAGQAHIVDFTLFSFLTHSALFPVMSPLEKEVSQKKLDKQYHLIKIWTANQPDNFIHLQYLMEAEFKRLEGKIYEADDLYRLSVKYASAGSFAQHEAIANELAAKLWFSVNKKDFGTLYLNRAHFMYKLWGADQKVLFLEKNYPEPEQLKNEKKGNLDTVTTISDRMGSIDISTIIKASLILLNEKNLKLLLEKLMKLMIENAGAEKGILILPQKNNWFIEAEYNINSGICQVLQSIPVDQQKNRLPESVFYFTINSGDSLVLNNIQQEEKFTNDLYIQKFQPLSVLCMPLINQGKVGGIVYLENNQTSGAFTERHLKILELLSAQAAISLENAILYEELEQRVKNRTEDLLIANEYLKTLNYEKNELLYLVTHNLKSPLAGVVGFASSINQIEDLSRKEIETYSGQILSGGKRMLKMIDDLLDINAIETGNYKINSENIEIVSFIEDLILNFTDQLKAKSLKLKFDEIAEKIYINADESWLAQILENLISNAIKYSPPGKNIFISLEKTVEKVKIQIIDQGPGLTEQDHQKLFQKFARLSAVPTGGENSTGLGLSIVKKMVEIMDGAIYCQSKAGQGANFIIEF